MRQIYMNRRGLKSDISIFGKMLMIVAGFALTLVVSTVSAQQSDSKAVSIAEQSMEAMGGKTNWDNTRYLRFTFFGSRTHHWDKWTGRYRLEGKSRDGSESYIILMNLNTKQGKAYVNGKRLEGEELKKRLEVLLGNKPDEPIDQSQKNRVEQKAVEKARKEGISIAGGQLLTAAFTSSCHVLRVTFAASRRVCHWRRSSEKPAAISYSMSVTILSSVSIAGDFPDDGEPMLAIHKAGGSPHPGHGDAHRALPINALAMLSNPVAT